MEVASEASRRRADEGSMVQSIMVSIGPPSPPACRAEPGQLTPPSPVVAIHQANARLRQEEFARLLEEHEQIVNEINRVETEISANQGANFESAKTVVTAPSTASDKDKRREEDEKVSAK